jgi:hypothetical protein
MKNIALSVGYVLFVAFLAPLSQAQVQRTFLSGLGSDANPCSRAAPCRTVATAIGQTNAGGVVAILDSAGYGPFTVNKAVTVEAPLGVYAGVTVFSGHGISVSIAANDRVTLRGLNINSQGTDGNGIEFNGGGTLHIENCVIEGFTISQGEGISVFGSGRVLVKDTILKNNTVGIQLFAQSSNTLFAILTNVTVAGNSSVGLTVSAFASALFEGAITRSSFSDNGVGIQITSADSGGTALMDVESCLITNNINVGLSVFSFSGLGAASISNCTISHNGAGYHIDQGAFIYSRVNNTIIGNGSVSGSLTPLSAQ